MGPWGWGVVTLLLVVFGGVSVFALPPLLLVGLGALAWLAFVSLRDDQHT